MSLAIGLSGLNAAKTDLEVTSNNIANSSTIGFKSGRAEFADVYASSVSSGNNQGAGVKTANISQQFAQGTISYTNNALDMAINGKGFFIINNNGELNYTRAGFFSQDAENFLVNNEGGRLQGFSADADGNILAGTRTDIRIAQDSMPAQATTNVTSSANLDSRKNEFSIDGLTNHTVNPSDAGSFTDSLAFDVSDSLGGNHTITLYFSKLGFSSNIPTTPDNTWQVDMFLDGNAASTQRVGFNSSGSLEGIVDNTGALGTPAVRELNLSAVIGGADNLDIDIDISGFSQTGTDFSVNEVNQNGFPPGLLTGIQISEEGIVQARYSNSQVRTQGQITLANFANPNGLINMGNSLWAASPDAGIPVTGIPGTGIVGSLETGALEQSNVDLSGQMVRLIEAQSHFQANAKTIETNNTLIQTLMNII
ncbi:MAG: flagellar hook protein FlgE [Endozoicomonas sp. (ex Botrylloides leachii)]|nr:flagellar hook protein FlgE [Endozoicomonas sp. (ex Botrylloides leachii)]